jgi:hypothetical protein
MQGVLAGVEIEGRMRHDRTFAGKLTRSQRACAKRLELAGLQDRLGTCGACGMKFPRTPYTFSPLARGHSACSGTCLERIIQQQRKAV